MNNSSTWKRYTSRQTFNGFTLLEVLIGMVIFAIGMMALAQLQGNLTKSSSDSNARSVAVNIAEETIEAARSFAQVTAGVGLNAFNNIVTGSTTENRGGIDYTIARVVTNYYYVAPGTVNASGSFTTTKPATQTNPDMKRLQVTVTWGNGQTFQIDDSQNSAALGSGSIRLTDMISSITSPSGGKVVLNSTTTSLYGPPVDYNPGENPDIVSIQLGQNRFKESTKPLPKVFNANERVETSFDVVTYSQNDAGATFLRREEFLAVACECTLRLPSASTDGGLRPTLWNGNDYTEGQKIFKPYGVSARDNNQNFQSEYCTVCCRDHHDGGSGSLDVASDPGRARYSPFKSSSEYYSAAEGAPTALVGDHKHYNIGGVTLATGNGDTYFEACRMVRKDGFFRVAQDARQEGLNSFPGDYLDEDAEVAVYSKYVTDAINMFTAAAGNDYEISPPTLTKPASMSPVVTFPASLTSNRTNLTVSNSQQQLRSRGVYIDYLTDEIKTIVNCLNQSGSSGATCGVEGSNSALEIIPFFDVQLTWLARWNEAPINTPIKVSNDEAIQTGNTHDRGRATLVSSGNSTITTNVNGGNLGLTGSDPIDGTYGAHLKQYPMYAYGNTGTTPPPPQTGFTVSGTITSTVNGVKASDVVILAVNGAQCDRTNTGFTCVVPFGASNPRMTVNNYFKRNRDLVGCSSVLAINGTAHSGTDITQNWTRFNLPAANINNAHIVVKEGLTCG